MHTGTEAVTEFQRLNAETVSFINQELAAIREMQYNRFYIKLLCEQFPSTRLLDRQLDVQDLAQAESAFIKTPSASENSRLLHAWENLNERIIVELKNADEIPLLWDGVGSQLQDIAFVAYRLRGFWIQKRLTVDISLADSEGFLNRNKVLEAHALKDVALGTLRMMSDEMIRDSGLDKTLASN